MADAIAVSQVTVVRNWASEPTDRLLILGDAPGDGGVALYTHGMSKKHEDTSVSLHPLTFEEAIKKLSRKGSPAAPSRRTKSDASPPPDGKAKRTAPRVAP